MIKVSDYIIKRLAEHGVKHIFMVPGGGAMHIVDSIGNNKKIKYICNHHEQAASIAAEGYARAVGKMAGVSITSGPGGTNALTGVIGQWLDSIPCIYISGQVKRETTIKACPDLKLRQLGDQEINIVDIVRPVTKYAEMVIDANAIGYHIDRAVYLANHGRPGPVWLDIPLDIQAAMIDPGRLEKYSPGEDEISFDRYLLEKQVKELLSRIDSCKRPVLIAGNGVRLSGALKQFQQLVRQLNIPVLTAISGADLIYSDHPLFFGRPGICGNRLGNIIVQNSDLLVIIGSRLGIRQIGYNFEAFAREAYRAMVDIDPCELDKPILPIHMKIHADAKLFMTEMLQQMGGRKMGGKKEWIEWARERKRTLPTILQDNPRNPAYVSSYSLADELFKQLMPGDMVVTGNGTAYTGTFQIMHIKKGIRVFANEGCAAMGYGLPAAMGACFARGKKPVVLLTGDGSIQMNIQELQTVVHHNLPIKIFILSNKGYISIRNTQDTYFEGRYYASSEKKGITFPDFCRVARAYGIASTKIGTEKNLAKRISEVLKAKGPVVCEVFMDPKQTLFPKLSSEMKPGGRLVAKPLEDMYPFLDREEFKNHMIIKTLEE